jgi:hypothetical protein
MGIHLQARAGDLNFLQVKKSEMTGKIKKYLSVWKSSVFWKDIAEK